MADTRWEYANLGQNRFGRACWSIDGAYRYVLIRRWGGELPLTWIMCNPSTAGAGDDDATIRKCVGYAQRWGYGGIRVLNLFALVATDPKTLMTAADPVGPENDRLLGEWLYSDTWTPRTGHTADVLVAWGDAPRPCGHRDRDVEVAGILAAAGVKPMCLGTTGKGQPRHPGRTAYDLDRVPWPLA